MWLNVSNIFIRECGRGFQSLELAINIDLMEVLHTQYLESIPYYGGVTFLASDEPTNISLFGGMTLSDFDGPLCVLNRVVWTSSNGR